MKPKPQNPPCQKCELEKYNTLWCNHWRLAFAMNELKKSVPPLWCFAVLNMQCPDFEAETDKSVD